MIPSLPRFAALATALLAALAALGAWPTHAIWGADGLVAAAVGIGIALVAALAAFAIVARASRAKDASARTSALLLGTGLRMLLTAAATFAILETRLVAPRAAFAAWILLAYAALLVLETVLVVRAARHDGSGGVAAA